MSNPKLEGILPPVVTPLLGRDELDSRGLEKLLEHILAGGVSGLFILGTTGEGPSLSYRLRREVIERVCKQVNRRVPVLVNVTDTAFVESVNLARIAAKECADALVIAPPYYMPEAQPELLEYLDHLVPELPLPVYLYNMPSLTKVTFELDTLRHAMDNPRVIGLKDSSGSLDYFRRAVEFAKHRPDWPVFVGPEEMLADATVVGGSGGVNGGANLFPRLYVDLFNAARSNDKEHVADLHEKVLRVSEGLYRIGRHSSSIIKGIKCALSVMGMCNDFMAEPFHRFRTGERALVEKRLRELQELIGHDGKRER
jgi:4-hydroxy-tetrahydrodipicolinate synthase